MSNDLISREALKNKIKELPWTGDESYYDRVGLHAITDLIDNAPTVEPEVYMTAKDYNLYLEGYKQGRKDFGRSHGEWMKDGVGQFKCSLCGRAICTSISNDKPYEDFPFCHCGADMRGEEK